MTELRNDPDKQSSTANVFVSYSREDRGKVLPIIQALEKAGLTVWWDGLLEAGTVFLQTTEQALDKADIVFVVWTKTSVHSNWVRDEATSGRETGRLVPITIDGSLPPLGFRQFQVADLSEWRENPDAPEFHNVIQSIWSMLNQQSSPQRFSATPVKSAPLTRRNALIGGGAAIVVAGSGIFAWQSGWIGEVSAADHSIAVVPFANLSGDPEQNYFSEGLSEELRTALSRNKLLRVAAPTSSSNFRDLDVDAMTIAAKLSVAFVLRGSVRREGDTLRIVTELINGKDATVRWAESFDRKLQEVFALQSEIADTVATALASEMTKEMGDAQQELGGTSNMAAFDAYLKGKALFKLSAGEASDRAALARLDAATAADPKFAAAYALRSKLLIIIANFTNQSAELRQLYDRAIASAQRAISIEPKLAEGHSALGYALYNGQLDLQAAQAPFDKSRDLGAGDADILGNFALYSAFSGRPEAAREAITHSERLDPLNPNVFRSSAFVAYAARDYSSTIRLMKKALSLNPTLSVAHASIGNALLLLGNTKEAEAEYQSEPVRVFSLTGLAIARHKSGSVAEAKTTFDELVEEYGDNSLYQHAEILAQWGEIDGAIGKLEQAWEAKDAGMLLAKTDPFLDPLRANQRFIDLLSTSGLAYPVRG